ncbi:hypothetical protein FQN53_005486 [Emmonsiellopsis sp. PD_33]|nr:hypothetical protein FQN53_005486 [Emmonsiellopsis sp. PD_33]
MKLLNPTVAVLGLLPCLSAAIPVADPEADLEMNLEKRRSAQTCKIVNVNRGNYVNCRYGPSMEAGEIFGFPPGDKLTFACYKKGDCVNGVCTWDQITYLKTTCYVNGYYTDNHCTSSNEAAHLLFDQRQLGADHCQSSKAHFPLSSLSSDHLNPGHQTMKFQFVENGNTDPATRKLIRSHVMKGKNVGKVRARPTQKRIIERNLENDSLPSDSTIAAVMFMAVYDDLTGQPARSKVHVEALYRMVELRGGLDQLKANRLVLQKVCRVDIRYAIFAGVHPRFARNEFPHKMVHQICSQSTYRENGFSLPNGVHVYDPYLRGILVDFMGASRYMNDETAIAGLDPCQYNDAVISVCYRLLSRYPLAGSGPESDNDKAYYLGILGLVIPLLFRRFRFQPVHYDLLMTKLCSTIEKVSSNYNKRIKETTLLWLLFASGISILDPAHWVWLIPRIKSLLVTLKLDSWESTREEIKQLPWMDATHDKPGKDLWQAVAETGPSE